MDGRFIDTGKLLIPAGTNVTLVVPVTGMPDLTRPFEAGLAKAQNFEARPGQILTIPNTATGETAGEIERVYVGVSSPDAPYAFAAAAAALPAGDYEIDDTALDAPLSPEQAYEATRGWALARYQFKIENGAPNSDPGPGPRLVIPQAARQDLDALTAEIKATWLVRDLINMPANILNTRELSAAVTGLANIFNVKAQTVKGEELEREFPLVYAVGKASENPPILTYFEWTGSGAGDDAPTILLAGKGVTYDTGGLGLKPAPAMEPMKKDMGGAAIALGTAIQIMSADLPVRLKVMVPIAENAVAGNAFRNGDILTARDGTAVYINHTDAEGRLLLADALSYGVETWQPDYVIDFATLTGAQRVADGTDVGAVITNDIALGRRIEDTGHALGDDLKFHRVFKKHKVPLAGRDGADIQNSPRGPDAPGLEIPFWFLQHFIDAAVQKTGSEPPVHVHFDISAWNDVPRPGKPKGGEAMGMRAINRIVQEIALSAAAGP